MVSPYLLVPAIYLGGVNSLAFGLFAYDKYCARFGMWRVPEKTLCLTAALNGWIGGMVAMEMFRHKTVKQSFRQEYFKHVGIGILWALPFAHPSIRTKVFDQLGIKPGQTNLQSLVKLFDRNKNQKKKRF